MSFTRRALLAAAIAGVLTGSSSAGAKAGTKYVGNLVPTGGTAPTLSSKSKFVLKGNGQFKAVLRGVTASTGLVTSERTGTLDGDEYVALLSGTFVALSQPFQFNLVTDLKNGNGVAKIDASRLFVLVPTLIKPRSVRITGMEVYGPLGAENAAACQAKLASDAPFILSGGTNPCVDETQLPIAVGGIEVP